MCSTSSSGSCPSALFSRKPHEARSDNQGRGTNEIIDTGVLPKVLISECNSLPTYRNITEKHPSFCWNLHAGYGIALIIDFIQSQGYMFWDWGGCVIN